MRLTRLATLFLASGAAWTLLATHPENAYASKTVIHGSECEASLAVAQVWWSETPHTSQGIINRSNGWEQFVCPLPRLNGVSGQITDIEVSVHATHANLWCLVVLRDRFGGSGVSSSYRTAQTTGDRIIDLGNPRLGSYYEGSFHVICGLPPDSRIASITIDQT